VSMSSAAFAVLLDQSNGLLQQLQGSGVNVHFARQLGKDGRRAVRVVGAAGHVHGAKLVIERCEAQATASRTHTERLSPEEGLLQYYRAFYEHCGLHYQPPQRLWQDKIDQDGLQYQQWASYYSSLGYMPSVSDVTPMSVEPPRLPTEAGGVSTAATGDEAAGATEDSTATSGEPGQESGSKDEVAEALLPGWSAATDSDGRSYYFHAKTQATQWERPTQSSQMAPAANAPEGAEELPALPEGWRETSAADGRKYYYQVATGQTSWKRPAAAEDNAEAEAGAGGEPEAEAEAQGVEPMAQ